MKTLLISALALSVAGPVLATAIKQPSRAEAACDEQLGEFRRDGANVYCEVDGVIYEGKERQVRAAPPRIALDRLAGPRPKPNSRSAQDSDPLNRPPKQ